MNEVFQEIEGLKQRGGLPCQRNSKEPKNRGDDNKSDDDDDGCPPSDSDVEAGAPSSSSHDAASDDEYQDSPEKIKDLDPQVVDVEAQPVTNADNKEIDFDEVVFVKEDRVASKEARRQVLRETVAALSAQLNQLKSQSALARLFLCSLVCLSSGFPTKRPGGNAQTRKQLRTRSSNLPSPPTPGPKHVYNV